MKFYRSFFFIICVIMISSCATKIRSEVYDENYRSIVNGKVIYVLRNANSVKHLNTLFPPAYFIDKYEEYPNKFKFVEKIDDIDEKIVNEFVKYSFKVVEINSVYEIMEDNAIVIFSQDVWQWDFKNYMHILKVHIYMLKNHRLELLVTIGSEGNSAGLHNYPSPDSEIPRIINEILE